jgi:tRNA pseudouridine55 synthase
MSSNSMKGGILVLDKPAGPTSFAVVERVRRALGAAKAGHTGTLDPAATGVLAVCLDDAVKIQHWITEGDKAYEALVAFGVATDTEDGEGREIDRGDPTGLTAERVAAALPAFVGAIDQVPPMYSAVRVGGRRLHESARAGKVVERAPRRVVVHSLELLAFAPALDGLARARIAVRCGKGTYVRTIATSLGTALGVPAHLAALRRTASGPFTIATALPLDELERLAASDRGSLDARLVPPADALAAFPVLRVTREEVRALAQGKILRREAPGALARALDEEGALVAMVAPAEDGEGIRPVRVFVQPPDIPGPGPLQR